MTDFSTKEQVINDAFRRNDLSADDILSLVIADRLLRCSDNVFAAAMGRTR